jgi:hypothetical protein
MGEPPPPCVAKTIAIADRHSRAFIASSPFVLIASANALGRMDISPKGDAPGFRAPAKHDPGMAMRRRKDRGVK